MCCTFISRSCPTVFVKPLVCISIGITMQGAFGAWGIHSGLITWTSHPIKDISRVQAGLSNSVHVQTCLGRLLILQKGWNACDSISWHLFMWWSESVNSTCCRFSKGQRRPGRGTGMLESWHFMTTHGRRDNSGGCVCRILPHAVTWRPFESWNVLLEKTLELYVSVLHPLIFSELISRRFSQAATVFASVCH